jgi:hypothetical protein
MNVQTNIISNFNSILLLLEISFVLTFIVYLHQIVFYLSYQYNPHISTQFIKFSIFNLSYF